MCRRAGRWAYLAFAAAAAAAGCDGGGSGPSCPAAEAECGGVCVELGTDARNCGACGAVCAPGEVCADGGCAVACPGTQQVCDGGCFDLRSSSRHCGDCGTACAPGEACVEGVCTTSCPGTEIVCGGTCVEPQTDRTYCGATGDCAGDLRGSVCAPGEVCSEGSCGLSCGGTTPTLCGAGCVDTDTDRANCGGCGHACAWGEVCNRGWCALSCGGMTPAACGGICVSTETDRANCGGCGVRCAPGEVCSEGSCGLSCGGTTPTLCGTGCTNTDLDRANCGGCGVACAAGRVCSGGRCTTSCPDPQISCGGSCVDPLTDRTYCGAAPDCSGGTRCAIGELCVAGACTVSCPRHQLACDGRCVDPRTDRAHCGASGDCTGGSAGMACAARELCDSGECRCVPLDCTGRECGDDGCGGTCGTGCSSMESCFAEGFCSPIGEPWVRIPAGTFVMGSPTAEIGRSPRETQHSVRLTHAFIIESTEVTETEFWTVMGWGGWNVCPTCPKTSVTWHEAAAYCNGLSAATRRPQCYRCSGGACTPNPGESPYDCLGYRLPTEAEWEYAARAGDGRATYNGNLGDDWISGVLDPIAWYYPNMSDGNYEVQPARGKAPNAWGLYDMIGNAWELSHDSSNGSDYSVPSGTTVEDPWRSGDSDRAMRGCSYLSNAGPCRAAMRAGIGPSDEQEDFGFRPVRRLP